MMVDRDDDVVPNPALHVCRLSLDAQSEGKELYYIVHSIFDCLLHNFLTVAI